MTFSELANFIWSVADDLRGDYKQADYGKIILPFALLRRLDCVLEPTKAAVLAEYAKRKDEGVDLDIFLKRKSKQSFYNVSEFTFTSLLDDQKHIRQNLVKYIGEFSDDARDVFERFKFLDRVAELDDKDLLFLLVKKFASIDMHPDVVPNESMGLAFEELIRKFAEASNETAGEHFTPREVIKLMVHLIFAGDDAALSKPGAVRSIYDPTAGTGGMLSGAEHEVAKLNPSARLRLFGQELNDESYAICKADMLIKGQDPDNIHRGNTLSDDQLPDEKFDYMLSNPPFGVDWKKVHDAVKTEHEKKGYGGRFGPGLPRVSDGSMLFLLHLISKMRPAADGGSRFGIVLNGSPLFTGGAGSGESEIRRYALEHDLVEAIVALPTDMFFNTGIATYVWILSNRKTKNRKGHVQLIDGSSFWEKMRPSLGAKRRMMSDADIAEVTRLFADFSEARLATVLDPDGKEVDQQILRAGQSEPAAPEGGKLKVAPISRIFKNEDFGYRTITVEQPLRDDTGNVVLGDKGKLKGEPQPDPALRDTENVPLAEDVETYFKREVVPHVPGAWIDHDKTKVGYEIPFNRHFYLFEPPRDLKTIAADLKLCTDRILTMIAGLSA
ncbi:MAG: N-6 DNA methylase [Thiobacillaceae bacterium]